MGTSLDDLLDLLELERLEVNLFRGVSPKEESQQRVFGGLVAAQALVAAGRTVDLDDEPRRALHSLHAYFLRPGDPARPIVYDVDRIRDGRSFTTRRVVAVQHGRAIFNLAASFQVIEPGPDHQLEMPDVPVPEVLPTLRERLAPYMSRFPPEMAQWLLREKPVEQRHVEDPPWLQPTVRLPAQDVWIRANGTLPEIPLIHECVLAYASDMTLLDTARLPHAVAYRGQLQMASLDHAMWFHRPFRSDDWLLYHQTSPSTSGARGLALGHVFRADGTLVATVIQEGLMRPL